MAIPNLVVVKHKEGRVCAPESGLKRRVLAYNEKLFLAEHEMEKGWVRTLHSHPHDQIVYVVHGHLRVNSEGQTTLRIQRGRAVAPGLSTVFPLPT